MSDNGFAIKIIGVGGAGSAMAGKFAAQESGFVTCARLDSADTPATIDAALSDAGLRVVIVVAGMGGHTATEMAPAVARAAREHGLLTLAVVTVPFLFEGQKKFRAAMDGIDSLMAAADAVMAVDCERLREKCPDLDLVNAFDYAAEAVVVPVRTLIDTVCSQCQALNVDMGDLCSTLRAGGRMAVGEGFGDGKNRVADAIEAAFDVPLRQNSNPRSARRIMLVLTHNPYASRPLTMAETATIGALAADGETRLVFGIALDPSLGDRVKATIIASDFDADERRNNS